jgi:CheY-like chemotaxis protein
MESAPGEGSTFHFTVQLPFAPGCSEEPPFLDLEGLRGLPVLIIDDHAANRNILYEITRHWRMKSECADSGVDGLMKLRKALAAGHPFRLILLDEEMPGMSGAETMNRIHANPELAAPTIMMLTAKNQAAGTARCQELGADRFLIKPLKATDLLEAIRKATGMAIPEGTSLRIKPAKSESIRSGLRILLAEDNRINQKLAVAVLRKMGHQAIPAANGVEAVTSYQGGNFDLILMDVQMPEMDGFEATAKIREQERLTGSHVLIIAMTANAMAGDRESCINAGMDDYIAKPVNRKELEQVIARNMSRTT